MKQRTIINNDIIEELLLRHNPLGFCPSNGMPASYDNVESMYFNMMQYIIANFKEGYIETPYLISILYPNLDGLTCLSIGNDWELEGFRKICFVGYDKTEGKVFFTQMFTKLHELCGSKMNEQAFYKAYERIKIILTINKK